MTIELVRIENLQKFFPIKGGLFGKVLGHVRAVDGVSFTIKEGTTLGLVGESGCGKSTLGRTILRLYEPSDGKIYFQGIELNSLSAQAMRAQRREMQMIFQDPASSLNPRMTVGQILEEPFIIHKTHTKKERALEIAKTLETVGLNQDILIRYPHEFSGGQRQRISTARAISLRPKFIVCDEPVSALDVSIRSQLLNLLVQLRKEYKLTYLFISHDLAVIEHISDHIAVMYLGRVVEITDNENLYSHPSHPYTKALMAAIPRPDFYEGERKLKKAASLVTGDVPSPLQPPSGCHFHPRCPLATERCKNESPLLRNIASENRPHWVSCHYA